MQGGAGSCHGGRATGEGHGEGEGLSGSVVHLVLVARNGSTCHGHEYRIREIAGAGELPTRVVRIVLRCQEVCTGRNGHVHWAQCEIGAK